MGGGQTFTIGIGECLDLISNFAGFSGALFGTAQDFISNVISYRKLTEAMHLEKLGEQLVLKSAKAHERLHFIDSVTATANEYYAKKRQRDLTARKEYRSSKLSSDSPADIFMLDIMREEIKPDDPRLR